MPGTVIVGTQWGDEGKGRFTDYLAKEASLVRPLPGRPQRRATRSSSTARCSSSSSSRAACCTRGSMPVIGNGVVVDPAVLLDELDMLEAQGHRHPPAARCRATRT